MVPGAAHASLDLRHENDGIRATALKELLAEAQAIAARRSLTVEWAEQMSEPAVPMDPHLTYLLAEALEATGFPTKTMPSGAGHDAMVLAARVPTAMLFLRSPGGVSHHPDEVVREEDVEAALQVSAKFLEQIAAGCPTLAT